MKKITLLFTALLFSTIVSSQNIIKNGGFETRTGESWADNWVFESGNDTEDDQHKEGEHSARLTSQNGFIFTIYQTGYTDPDFGNFVRTKVEPDASYKLTYWVLDNTDKATLKHKVRWLDKDENYIKPNYQDALSNPTESSQNSATWKQITATGKAPSNAKYVAVFFYAKSDTNGSGKSVYLDEVSLTKEQTASVNDEILNTTICFYNTASKSIHINVNPKVTIQTIKVFNILGMEVLRKNSTSTSKQTIPAPITNGIAIVQVTTNRGTFTKKIIIN